MKIHLHFDTDKPDEERALMILEEWQQQTGLPPQKIMVMALLALGSDPAPSQPADDFENSAALDDLRDLMLDLQDQSVSTMREVRYMMDHVREVLEQGLPVQVSEPVQIQQTVEPEAEPVREQLPDAFVASLKKGVKPGFTLDE
jgi:hypothetical protein